MIRLVSVMCAIVLAVTACAPGGPGSSSPGAYRIGDRGTVQYRMLDSINALRGAAGSAPVALDTRLNAAAATHARDMSVQNRPWHFGSDGSSPIDRINRVSYSGSLVGEVISETFETEIETLGAWMQQPDTRRVLLSPQARNMGFAWYQEPGGKIWWTLVMGD